MVALSDILIPRNSWGARPPKAIDGHFTKDGGVVVHYSASDSSTIKGHWPDCYDRWQGHQNYHMDKQGWNDLAYNFGVCVHGFIFEGRGWDAQNGANRPVNASTLSICLDVDENDTFDVAVVHSINELIRSATEDHGWARRLRGHGEASGTGTPCPGANVKALLAEGKISLPSKAATPPPPPPVVVVEPQPEIEPPAPVPTEVFVEAFYQDEWPTILQMQAWARKNNATPLFIELAAVAYREGILLGFNPAIIYAIMAHETAFGRFGGVLDVSFNNFGGIKTPTGGGNFDPEAHTRFPTAAIGVRAVAQHAARYFGLSLHRPEIEDPRYDKITSFVNRLPHPNWGWASTSHAPKVVGFVKAMTA